MAFPVAGEATVRVSACFDLDGDAEADPVPDGGRLACPGATSFYDGITNSVLDKEAEIWRSAGAI